MVWIYKWWKFELIRFANWQIGNFQWFLPTVQWYNMKWLMPFIDSFELIRSATRFSSAVLHMQNDNWRDSIWSTKYKSVIVHNIWGQEKGWALVSVNIYPCRLICVCMLVHNAKHATVAVMGWRLQHCSINKPSPYKSVTKISSEAESK